MLLLYFIISVHLLIEFCTFKYTITAAAVAATAAAATTARIVEVMS